MRGSRIFVAALAYFVLVTAAAAGPIYDFVVTSISGPTTTVSGFLQFDDSGNYAWADVVAASFKVNGMQGLSSFVGGPTCNPIPTNCITFTFVPNGRTAAGNIFANNEFTTLRLNGAGQNWSGSFLSDNQCSSGSNPCLFTGYWDLRIVPEPSSIAPFASGVFIMGMALWRRRRRGL